MSLGPLVRELPGNLSLGAVDPDVQGVLLQDDPEHGSVHGEDPGLHHLGLLLDERLVGLAVHLEGKRNFLIPVGITRGQRMVRVFVVVLVVLVTIFVLYLK